MKRILSLVLCALMVIAIVPMTVFAEEAPVATFTLGADGSTGHVDGSSATTYSETVNGYTLSITGGTKMYTGGKDEKGNSALKLGTSSVVGGFSFTVPEDVTSVVIYAAKYKAKTSKINVNGTEYTLSNSSNDGAYDAITVDTSATKTVNFTTVSGGVRCMINTIEFYAAGGSTEPDPDQKYTVTVVSEDTTVDTAEVDASTEYKYTLPAATEKDGYTFEGWSTGVATYQAGAEVTINANTTFTAVFKKIINFPEADSVLTIEQVLALCAEMEADVDSPSKYYVTGVITEVYNTTYGNMYIKDEAGNILTVYGTYSADGSTRYDALEVQPVAGDQITVYGVVCNFNGNTPEMKYAWITEHVAAEPTPDPEPEPEPDPDPEPEPDPDPTPDVPTGDAPAASFDFGENVEVSDGAEDHKDGNEIKEATSTYTDGNYTLTITDYSKAYVGGNDEMGNSALKMGTSSVVGTFTFAVPEDVVKVVIYVAMYKAKATAITINGEEYTITTSSNDGAYTAIEIDTSVTKSITVATVSGKTRCMIDKIEFYNALPSTEEVKTAVWVDGYQKSAVEGDVYNVRFAVVINGFFAGQDYVGVEITTTAGGGKSWDLKTNTVYRSISANFGTEAVTAAERGGQYITAAAITGVPTSVGAVEFVVTPYVIVGGAKVYGEAVTVTVNP